MIMITQKRYRITIDVDQDLRRRVRIAAAEKDVSVKEYILSILDKSLSKHESSKAKNIQNEETIT